MNSSATAPNWDGRTIAAQTTSEHTDPVFEVFFERSIDAVWLLDPQAGVFVDCNQAAVNLIGAENKQQLLRMQPAQLSPPTQSDGSDSTTKAAQIIALIQKQRALLFEWTLRRLDGKDVPIEVSATVVQMGQKSIQVIVSRDISERKKAERELRELTQALERRVIERTAELSASEARFRALVEHAPEAIVVFDGITGRFLFGNEHACRLYGVPMEKLAQLTPEDVSPEFQSGGRRTRELARELIDQALRGEKPVFEWIHRQPDGRLIPTEVRLLPLTAEGQNLIRASIIDNSERKKAERALRDSEAKFRALFEGASQGVVLHDENQILEVNPAAVRILGRQFAHEIIGRHPGEFSPPTQPNGEPSDTLARRNIEECMAAGSARFEWLASDPKGREIPMEVYLTRIEWSGRQVIQAFITDITERVRSAAALAESEARFGAAFRATPVSMSISRMDDGRFILANQAFLDWTGYQLEEVLGHDSLELRLWADPAERGPFWTELREKRFIHSREIRVRNRHGGILTLLFSADIIEIQRVPHLLSVGLDITARKQTEAELRASEARLRESEARFSVAFQASSNFIAITRVRDGHFVLVNDAFVNWSGYPRDEILGRNAVDLGFWEHPDERRDFWDELNRNGSIRQRECHFRNRAGRKSIMLISAEIIQLGHEPHMLGIALDISERKKAEAELRASEAQLRESEARFSVAFHASPALIGILRRSDGRFVLANDAHLNWLGYTLEEVLGRTCLELGMWENPEERDDVLKTMLEKGSVRQRECRWQNRYGEKLTVLLSIEAIELNETPHMLSMALDISERKRVEEELRSSEARLRESEARFSVAFEASPMFINILRMSDGNYVWANDAFVNRLGYSQEEVLGRSSSDFGMWVDPAEREAAWETMRTTGSIRQREVRWRDRHGAPFTILLSAEIIKFNDAPHILSMALDITQRKRAEVELLKTLEREKELSQLKSNFVSMVSHEFRTPLGIIQSSAELLRDFHHRMQPAERDEQLESVSRNTRRMAGMMEEILVLSRLDAGKLSFQPASLDLNAFFHRVVDEVLSATNRRCMVELSLKVSPVHLQADERLLSHIFTNLLSNGIKYSEAGSTVDLSVTRDQSDLVCVIRDQGIGIPKDDQEQLFRAFHRGSNVGTRPGTGLGLLLVKRCADLHGASVQMNSRVGQGTTVTVRLPLVENEL